MRRPVAVSLSTARAVSRTALLVLFAAMCSALVSGCRGSPIQVDGERSQFDRHDALQGDWTAAYREDEFGRRVPNVRARLLRR